MSNFTQQKNKLIKDLRSYKLAMFIFHDTTAVELSSVVSIEFFRLVLLALIYLEISKVISEFAGKFGSFK